MGPDKTWRVVVKSLPSVGLIDHAMRRGRTRALMVFHRPFLNAVAQAFPDADALFGKPMPVSAAERFYSEPRAPGFDPARQVQWLIDSHERLLQYRALARRLGVHMRVNVEIDVGLHRGGVPEPPALTPLLAAVREDPEHLSLAGFMGYEPHLTGLGATLDHPAVRTVLASYRGFVDRARADGFDLAGTTLNGAGSHTLRIYEQDRTMNDLAAGSGVVKPTDFDTHHLADNAPALFIAAPVLKRYDRLRIPGDPWMAHYLPWWDPNMRRVYYIYGGYWKARPVSPAGLTRSTTAPTSSRWPVPKRRMSRSTTTCSCARPRANTSCCSSATCSPWPTVGSRSAGRCFIRRLDLARASKTPPERGPRHWVRRRTIVTCWAWATLPHPLARTFVLDAEVDRFRVATQQPGRRLELGGPRRLGQFRDTGESDQVSERVAVHPARLHADVEFEHDSGQGVEEDVPDAPRQQPLAFGRRAQVAPAGADVPALRQEGGQDLFGVAPRPGARDDAQCAAGGEKAGHPNEAGRRVGHEIEHVQRQYEIDAAVGGHRRLVVDVVEARFEDCAGQQVRLSGQTVHVVAQEPGIGFDH